MNLRRKRIYGEASTAVETQNGMESGNEGEHDAAKTARSPRLLRETRASARYALHNSRSEEDVCGDGDNDDDDADSSSRESNTADVVRREEVDGDLWDEESLLAAPPRVRRSRLCSLCVMRTHLCLPHH
jgi:hypothetical protein